MTEAKSKSFNQTNLSRVMTMINRVRRWSYEPKNTLRILNLKTEELSDFLRKGSKLLNSIMENGKKKSFRKNCGLCLGRGILCIFLVEYNQRLAGVKLKRYLECSFSKTL